MKKKVVSALLATAMVATMVAGCGTDKKAETTAATEATTDAGSEAASEATSEATDVTEALAEEVDLSSANVAVFYYTFSDTYITSVRTALDAQLDSLGVTYDDYDANNN